MPGPPFYGINLDEWDTLEDSVEGRRAVARGLLDANAALKLYASSLTFNLRILAQLHQIAFERFVPDFAGRFRGPAPNYLPLNVSFGQHRGTPYEEVPDELERLSSGIETLISQLDERQRAVSAKELLPDVMTAAAWTHCELVRIHPFPNGNGRVSRLAINYFCHRYGLLPISVDRPRSDYIETIRAWLYYKKIEPCADFLASLINAE